MNAAVLRRRGAGAAALALALLLCAPAVGQTQDSELRELAAAAENAGRFDEAADHYLALVQSNPDRAQYVLDAGRCLGGSGRFNDAIDLLTRKRAEFPGLLDIPALLARTHLLRVERDPAALHPDLDYRDAAELAEEVLRVDPNHEDARLILAQARYSQGDREAAATAAREAIRRHPGHAGGHILLGRIALDELRLLQLLYDEQQPEEPRRGELLAAIDAQRERARVEFERAVELAPERTYARVVLGEIAARGRDKKAALRHWSDALAVDPMARVDHSWISTNVAPEERAAFYRAAAARYRERADADPSQTANLSFYEGLALYEQRQWELAGERFAATLAENPDYVNAAYYGAMCAWRMGDEDGAEALAATYARASATGFADVLRALPPDQRAEVAATVRYLGDRAFQAGRKDNSRDLNHVVACLLDSADAWNNYAFLCRETEKFDAAFAGYQHAIGREPGSPQLWNDAAVILQHHQPSPENFERARQMYEHALELAQRVLDDAASTDVERQRAAQAQQDAKANLAELPGG